MSFWCPLLAVAVGAVAALALWRLGAPPPFAKWLDEAKADRNVTFERLDQLFTALYGRPLKPSEITIAREAMSLAEQRLGFTPKTDAWAAWKVALDAGVPVTGYPLGPFFARARSAPLIALIDDSDDATLLERAQDLVASGVDVNATDSTGNTALIAAAARGHLEVVALLIGNGADVNRRGWEHTARAVAEDNGHTEVAELLRKHRAIWWSADDPGDDRGVVTVVNGSAFIDLRKVTRDEFALPEALFELVQRELERLGRTQSRELWVIPMTWFSAPGQIPGFVDAFSAVMRPRTTNIFLLAGDGPALPVFRRLAPQLGAQMTEIHADEVV